MDKADSSFDESSTPHDVGPLSRPDGGLDDDSFFLELPQDEESLPRPLVKGAPVSLLTLFDHLPVLVYAVDGSDQSLLTFWNRESEVVTGYSAHELVGNPGAWELLYPDPAYLVRKNAELGALGESFRDFEWTLTTKNQRRRRISWSTLQGFSHADNPGALWFVGVDVTARADADKLVRSRDKMLRSVFRYLPDMVHLKDGEGRWLLTNPAARASLGLSEREASGFTNLELADQGHPSGEALRLSALNEEATWQSGRVAHGEEVVTDSRGGSRVFDVVRVPTFGRQGQRLHMLVLRRDITDQRVAATKLELAGRVLDQSNDGMVIADAENRIMLVNAAFTEITGYSADEVLGRDPRTLSLGTPDSPFPTAVLRTLASHGRWTGEVWSRRKNGEVYPQWLNLSVLRHRSNGEITHYVAAFSDLSSSKAAEEKIAYLSTQDVVTGLPNRTHAALRASMALGHGRLTGQQAALMVVDIDNFKMLNDSLGHVAGDQLLREVSLRLTRAAGVHAVVGRLSGDEFLVLVPDVQGTTEAAHKARHLMEVVCEPTVIGGLPISISISAGVAMFPADGDTFEVLFALADTALYAAKRDGRGVYHFANAAMNEAALERLQMESALRRAIESNALRLEYQPLVELASGRIVGCEALCRWDDPELGSVPPALFIPLAEDSGLVAALGGWVLKTAALQLRQWHDAGHPELMMAVNLSARQFQRGVVQQQVEDALVVSGIPPSKLELELTESALLHDGEAVTGVLRQLKALGVKLSIDDFGTGYSSFAYLRRFKFDKIKIDHSFVSELIDDPDNAAIVRGIISLALSLGMDVLAEGVETPAVALRLKHMQCTYAQGYHFARPLRPEAFFERLGAA